jgi:hypothetical protein
MRAMVHAAFVNPIWPEMELLGDRLMAVLASNSENPNYSSTLDPNQCLEFAAKHDVWAS